MQMKIILLVSLFSAFCVFAGDLNDIKAKLGVKTESMENNLKEVDDKKGFIKEVGKYYVVEAKDLSQAQVNRVLKYMDLVMEEFVKLYEYPFGVRKVFVRIYGDREDYKSEAKKYGAENARGFEYVIGVNNYIVTCYNDYDVDSVLAHEALHAFVGKIFKNNLSVWLSEGLACYFETCYLKDGKITVNNINSRRLDDSKTAIKNNEFPKVKDLIRISAGEFSGQKNYVYYAASWSLIYYLRNKDEKSFEKFFKDLALGKSFVTSLKANYNIDEKQLNDELKEWIVKKD